MKVRHQYRPVLWLLAGALAHGMTFAGAPAPAAVTLYVNNKTGSALFDGRASEPAADGKSGPFATIMQAVEAASVSARIEIANTGTDYRESVIIPKTVHGTPGAPCVIDGNGSTVSGLVVIPAASWHLLKDDVYWFRSTTPEGKPGLMPRNNWIGFLKHQGWFAAPEAPELFFVDGKPAANALQLDALAPGGFFYDTQGSAGEARRVYFRLPAGAALEDLTLEMPLNQGVHVSSDYVVVRNLRSIRSQEDGFVGFWGFGNVYENIEGSFNTDQGFSMHGNSVTLVEGGLFERNGGMGIVDVMSSVSLFRNIVVRRNLIGGASFQGSYHGCRHSQFVDNAGAQVSGHRFDLEHCLVRGGWQGVGIRDGRLSHCTVVAAGQGITVGSAAVIENCLLVSNRVALVVAKKTVGNVKLTQNVIGPCSIEWGGERIGPDQWEAFAQTNSAAVTGTVLETPLLEGPLHQLPGNSPLRKDGAFGAALTEFTGWRAID